MVKLKYGTGMLGAVVVKTVVGSVGERLVLQTEDLLVVDLY
jgi:hypothetical protein